ncbi:MAG: hypothetical protein KIT10_13175 [Flavobacteriales bacterium]|nr:hypothetical protein [Flavobacteriales bacterium]
MSTPKIMIAMAAALFAVQAAKAQGKYGATPEDSVTCVQNLSLYQEFMKQNSLNDAYAPWRRVLDVCPASSKGVYQNGTRLLSTFIQKEKDPARKAALTDSLYVIYDLRIAHFGEQAFVLGRKGVDMLMFSPDRCQDAFNILKESVDLGGARSEAGTLSGYYQALNCLYGQGKATKDQMLQDYVTIMEHIDANLSNEHMKPEDREYFVKARDNVYAMFFKVAECEDIGRIVTDMLKTRADDQELKVRLLRVLNSKECTEEKVYLSLAQQVHEAAPSSESAYSLGMYLVKRNDLGGAARYFKEAADLCNGCPDKVRYLLKAGQVASANGNHSLSRGYAGQILQIEPRNGEAMILVGNAISAQAGGCDAPQSWGVYWLAYDQYSKARSSDPSVADKAGDRMAASQARFPTASEAFFHQLTDGQSFQVNCGGLNESTTVRTRK